MAVPAIAVAENWRTVEAVFLGLAAALTGRFLRNQVAAGTHKYSTIQQGISAEASFGLAAEVELRLHQEERQKADRDLISIVKSDKKKQGRGVLDEVYEIVQIQIKADE